ncbi:hypothetical protein MCETE7_01645 [Acidimicrobiia bacterium]
MTPPTSSRIDHDETADPQRNDRLLGIALALDDIQHPEALSPMLIGIPSRAFDPSTPPLSRLELVELGGNDPVLELVGRPIPSNWRAVGLRAGAHARRGDDPTTAQSGNVVHIVHRDGTAVTVLSFPSVDRLVLGPDMEVRDGRVPDACRRLLGLPTAPPPASMTSFVVDSWLAVCAKTATLSPGLTWPEVVSLHPASAAEMSSLVPQPIGHVLSETGAEVPTPADIAASTERFGASLGWERFHAACISSRFTPCPNLTTDAAAWMDAGMFARWVHGELPPRELVLDVLDAVLQPGASDRVWATLGLLAPTD